MNLYLIDPSTDEDARLQPHMEMLVFSR